MSKLRSLTTSFASLALAAVIAAACGHDELLAGLDAGSGGVAGTAGGPDASGGGSGASGGSTAGGGSTASGGSSASGGGNNDAASDGLAGSAGAVADASNDSPADAIDDAADGGDALAAVVPDFKLVDENPSSSSSQKQVSPRDYLGQVSAWYFGHST